MKVTATIATRGDVPIEPLLVNYPHDWEVLVWDNGARKISRWFYVRGMSADVAWEAWQHDMSVKQMPVDDLGPYGRFAAIEYASNDLILTQDDDVIVSDPQAIVDALTRGSWAVGVEERPVAVVCNMPPEFRPHYPDSAMVGFGAAFHRDAPERAFARFFERWPKMERDDPLFLRESCRIFTTLTPRVLVDVAKQDLPYASDDNRLWRDPNHVGFREAALKMARAVRDQ